MRWMEIPVVMRTMAKIKKEKRYRRRKPTRIVVGLKSVIMPDRANNPANYRSGEPEGRTREEMGVEKRTVHGGRFTSDVSVRVARPYTRDV